MDFMLLVYPPIHGPKGHWVTNDLHKFRFRGRNIAIRFKSSECTSWPKCKLQHDPFARALGFHELWGESCPPRGFCVFQRKYCDEDDKISHYRWDFGAQYLHARLKREWNDKKKSGLWKKTPLLSPMIIQHYYSFSGNNENELGYVDNKYNVCQHRIGNYNVFLFYED